MNLLNEETILSARIQVPGHGIWFADIELVEEAELAAGSPATILIGETPFVGTILHGGPYAGRARYHVCGGFGGWGKTIKKQAYNADNGVKAATVLMDAAAAAGETLVGVSPTEAIGPHWVREEGPASTALNLLRPQAWWVGTDGITHVDARPSSAWEGEATIVRQDRGRGITELALDDIAGLLPGVTYEGRTVHDVEIEVGPSGLRATLWDGAEGQTLNSALADLVSALLPDLKYRGTYEFRVVGGGDKLDVQPVRSIHGLPSLARVPIRAGLAGWKCSVLPGTLVLVTFVDADPSRPSVVGFDDPSSSFWSPTSCELTALTSIDIGGAGGLGVARMTDPVVAGPFSGTILSGSIRVKAAM